MELRSRSRCLEYAMADDQIARIVSRKTRVPSGTATVGATDLGTAFM